MISNDIAAPHREFRSYLTPGVQHVTSIGPALSDGN